MGSSKKNDRKSSKKGNDMPRGPLPKKGVDWADFSPENNELPASNRPDGTDARKRQRYEQIGRELRQMFKDVVNEPIPVDLLELVDKLDEQFDDDPENKF